MSAASGAVWPFSDIAARPTTPIATRRSGSAPVGARAGRTGRRRHSAGETRDAPTLINAADTPVNHALGAPPACPPGIAQQSVRKTDNFAGIRLTPDAQRGCFLRKPQQGL